MSLTACYIIGSIVFVLAVGFGASYLLTRYQRRVLRSQAGVSQETPAENAWPQVNLATIGDRSKEENFRSTSHIHPLAGGGHVGRGRGGVHGVTPPKE